MVMVWEELIMQGNEDQFKASSEKSKLLFTPNNDNETEGRHFYDEDAGTWWRSNNLISV